MPTQQDHDHPRWRLTLELDDELREPLKALARENERSIAGELRRAVRSHVEQVDERHGDN